MAEKSFGSKILGIFVEKRGGEVEPEEPVLPEAGEKSAADLIAEIASAAVAPPPAAGAAAEQAAPAAGPVAATGPRPTHKITTFPSVGAGASVGPAAAEPAPSGTPEPTAPAVVPAKVDFDGIFRDAGMDVGDLDRVRKAEDLLANLPPDQPASVSRMIVEASLKAFGFQLEKIVQAAQSQKKALDTYVKVNETATAKAVEDARGQIKALEEKIAALHADIEKRTGSLASFNAAAQLRKEQVQRILDFFAQPKP